MAGTVHGLRLSVVCGNETVSARDASSGTTTRHT